MITAKNYAEQALKSSQIFKKEFLKVHPTWKNDELYYDTLAKSIEDSVHFLMPDGGKILDDDFKGLIDTEVRLPFPCITVSYFDPETGDKKLIIANELDLKDISESDSLNNMSKYSDKAICVTALLKIEQHWRAELSAYYLPCNWRNFPEDLTRHMDEFDITKGSHIWGTPSLCSHDYFEFLCKDIPKEELLGKAADSIGGEVHVILELCEALSCSNVGYEKVERKSNVRKLLGSKHKNKKSFDYYTLTIDTPSTRKVYDDADQPEGGERKSPRQHLRRGHIRKLQNGTKVFVSSCVVGSIENGKIKKDYEVKHDSL